MDPFVTELSLYFPWWESNGCCLKWKKKRREEKPCAHRKARKGEFGVPGEELDQFGSPPHLPCKRPAVTDADSVSTESRLGPPTPWLLATVLLFQCHLASSSMCLPCSNKNEKGT